METCEDSFDFEVDEILRSEIDIISSSKNPLPPMKGFSVCSNSQSGEIYLIGGKRVNIVPDDSKITKKEFMVLRKLLNIGLSSGYSFNVTTRVWKLLPLDLRFGKYNGNVIYDENRNIIIYYGGNRAMDMDMKYHLFESADWELSGTNFITTLQLLVLDLNRSKSICVTLSGFPPVSSIKNLEVGFTEVEEKSYLVFAPYLNKKIRKIAFFEIPEEVEDADGKAIQRVVKAKLEIESLLNSSSMKTLTQCIHGRFLYSLVSASKRFSNNLKKTKILYLTRIDFRTMEWIKFSDISYSSDFLMIHSLHIKVFQSKIMCFIHGNKMEVVPKNVIVYDTRSKIWSRLDISIPVGFLNHGISKGPLLVKSKLCFLKEGDFGNTKKERNEIILSLDLNKCFIGDFEREDSIERREYIHRVLVFENELLDVLKIQIQSKKELYVLKLLLV